MGLGPCRKSPKNILENSRIGDGTTIDLSLASRFMRLFGETADAEAVQSAFDALESRYSQPGRRYHNMEHISEMFELYDACLELMERPREVAAAIFFHDLIYCASVRDNERKSAILASGILAGLGADAGFIARVASLITCASPETNDEALFLDFDFAILGAEAARYEEYRKAIRDEYRMFSDEEFDTGRVAFLRSMLAREHIFHTAALHESLEGRARENIMRELASMGR